MELNSMIEQRRPLEAISSLPIAGLTNNGELKGRVIGLMHITTEKKSLH